MLYEYDNLVEDKEIILEIKEYNINEYPRPDP